MFALSKKTLYGIVAGVSIVVLIVLAFLIFGGSNKPTAPLKGQKLLILLIDGMRYDYASRQSGLKGFSKLIEEGVHPPYVDPIFPANSYPNWYAIATGQYGENSGFVQNYMYDPKYNEFFLMEKHPNFTHPHWWNETEPIWTLAQKSGVRTSMYFWGGCDVPIQNILPSRCISYRPFFSDKYANEEAKSKLEIVLDDFKNDRFDLTLFYHEPVDHAGHQYGPDSNQTYQAVRDIDGILDTFLQKIKEEEMENVVNVYIVSDHGMSKPENIIDIGNMINMDDVMYMMDKGSFFMILPQNSDAERRIYEALKANGKGLLHVYRKAEIPEELHIKNHRRTLDLVVRAVPGYVVRAANIEGKTYPNSSRSFTLTTNPGWHGYYSKEFDQMRAIMFAKGPAFKKGYRGGPIEQTDHYQIFCRILNLKPQVNDGKWDRVKDMLV